MKGPKELEGLISHQLGKELRELARRVPRDQAIVEIGSYKGKSTCYLASGVMSKSGEVVGARIWAIDPWDSPGNETGRHRYAEYETRAAFLRQIEESGMAAAITPVKGFSTQVASEWKGPSIGLLYIDGDHEEKSVRDDFFAWRPYLVNGATVAFDDWGTPKNPGVAAVVSSLATSGLLVNIRIRADQLAVGRYRAKNK